VESFINTFLNVTTVELEGVTVRLATPAESYGLSLAGMSALHVSSSTARGGRRVSHHIGNRLRFLCSHAPH
jgi:hypothetical protein